MAENFRLDPTGVAAGTKRLNAAGERLNTAVTALNVVLDDHEGCWGTDDIGKGFAQKYVQPATDVRKYSGEAGTGLVTTGKDLDKAAETFRTLDHDRAQQLDQSLPE